MAEPTQTAGQGDSWSMHPNTDLGMNRDRMAEMIETVVQQMPQDLDFRGFLLVLSAALFSSLFIGFLYSVFYRERGTGSAIYRSFPFLGLAVTTIFVTIQFSLPLSLGLLGALSIVRFRTPIKEPEEIGFIMLVIAAALCCATFNLVFLGALLTATVATLVLIRYAGPVFGAPVRQEGTVLITIDSADYRARSGELFGAVEGAVQGGNLDSVIEDGERTVLSFSFRELDRDGLTGLPATLARISKDIRADVYYARPAEP